MAKADHGELLAQLQQRFEADPERHPGQVWAKIVSGG